MVVRQFSQRLTARRAAEETFSEFIGCAQTHPSPRWVFRGQSQQWPLKPSVGRLKSYRPEAEILMLTEFKRSALQFLDREAIQNSWDLLAIAQHHGLPTRLIDWTTNSLVAAFFASQHSPNAKRDGEIVAVEARSVGFYRPDESVEQDPSEIHYPKFLYTPALATRIIAQRGLFSVHPEPTKPWRLRNQKDRFVIPAAMKSDFQRALFSVGMDAAFLMGDLDGLCRSLRWRFENGVLGA